MNHSISDQVIFMVLNSSDYACIKGVDQKYIAVSQPYAKMLEQENKSTTKPNFTQYILRDDAGTTCGTLLFAKNTASFISSESKTHEFMKEREQYREALLHDADYSYHVDLTENMIEKPLIANDPLVDYKSLDYPFPMNYDQYLDEWNSKFKMEHTKPENADEWITCKGLLKAYHENMRHIEFEYHIGVLQSYRRKIVLLSQDDETQHIIANIIIKDITKERNQELEFQKQLAESNKKEQAANLAKTNFFAQMSHDMRTPMNAILGFAEIGEQETSGQQSGEYFTHIKDSGKYLLGLINDTLDMSKIEQNKMELHPEPYDYKDFKEIINNMLLPKAASKGVQFSIRNDHPCGVCVEFDKMRLQQVFVNLIGNAIKFTPSGGRVELEIIVSKQIVDGRLPHSFIVRDNGIGMSEGFVKNKLFHPFEQEHSDIVSNETGTGLGVSIAKNLVELMGGSIRCESELGRGTTFLIQLCPKVSIDFVETKKESIEVDESVLVGKKVLLCEDHPMNIKIAVLLLEKKGIHVTVAKNGQEGVALFEQSGIHSFDAILMDVRMPVMDGLEAAKTIRLLKRQDAASIPIIALSANAFQEDREKSSEAGMNSHLAKPIDPTALYTTLYKEVLKDGQPES